MNITIKARHMEATEPMKQYAESKAAKLPRIFDDIQSIDVTLDIEADQAMVEFVVQARRKHTFVASDRNQDMYACVDGCLNKISQQLRRHKDKVRNHQGPGHGLGMTQ